ncbi:MAG: YfjI family protein [Pseudomonadota bacterium]
MTAGSVDITKPLEAEEVDTWPDDMLPLVSALGDPAPFPLAAFPKAMRDCATVLLRTTQAPDAIIGGSLLAAASLAAQAHADVVLPHGAVSPLSLFVVSVADSGERKTAVDGLVLRPHAAFEKAKHDVYVTELAEFKALSKADKETTDEPRKAVFMASDPTVEGMSKLLERGLQSVGIFSSEGGRFMGGHGMSEDNQLRTAAGLSLMWDGGALDRVRAGDGAHKLYGRRVALHLMVQPRAAFNWLGNPVLRDQGLFSRCLVGYPASTAGTRFFKNERPDASPEYVAYIAAMDKLLQPAWATNEMGELTPRPLTLEEDARDQWIALHDDIEGSIPTALANVRGFASKLAEQAARVAGVLALVNNPDATFISNQAMTSASEVLQWYIGEAVRLSGAQPQREGTERAVLLWDWLVKRGKRVICLAELTQYGPGKLRQAKVMRETMAALVDHYCVRPTLDPIEWEGRQRAEAWEVRL